MTPTKTIARIAGSALAGAAGFAIGFYSGFFLILSIWGLDTSEIAFVFIAGTLGVVGATLAIMWTVSSKRRLAAVGTTAGLGAILLLVVFGIDADAGALGVGAVLMVIVAAVLVRTGAVDPVAT